MTNLLAEWLITAGVKVTDVQAMVENHLKEMILKTFDPKKADTIFTEEGEVRQSTHPFKRSSQVVEVLFFAMFSHFLRIFLLLLLPVAQLLAFLETSHFPPNVTWNNLVDTEELLMRFLDSGQGIARQNVSMVKGVPVMGENCAFPVEQALKIFLVADTPHSLILYVHNDATLTAMTRTLHRHNSPRIGVLVNVIRGPNTGRGTKIFEGNLVSTTVLYRQLLRWPVNVTVTFGIATSPGAVNQYTKREMFELFATAEAFYLKFLRPFSVELEAYYLSHKFNVLENVKEIRKNRWTCIIFSNFFSYGIDFDVLREVIYFLKPRKVYLNVPPRLRHELNIQPVQPLYTRPPAGTATTTSEHYLIPFLAFVMIIIIRIALLFPPFYLPPDACLVDRDD